MFKGITRNWTFWGTFILFSLSCGVVGSKYLFKALPILSIDLTMTRKDALNKAAALVQQNQWQPLNYNQATSFESDTMTQFFAELECGGIDTFKKMIEGKLYTPYKWHVRHFKENVTHETHLYFTPEGTPYGFEIKLPDTEVSENLTVSQARDLALQAAQQQWNVTFEQFTEIEASKETKQNGRIDHCFVYEHSTKTLGTEGKYRIKLIVRGNQFCTLSQYVQIPESFTRKYQEMRSANTLLHTIFGTLFNILYLLIGGCIGGFLLIRKRYYLIKPLLIALCCIVGLNVLEGFNKLPLMWMHYTTATAESTFTSTYLLGVIFGGLYTFIMFFLAIGAAEGFDRIAFPDHFQFWKLWSKKLGGSLNIVGQTITGYCLFGINLLLMSGTYYILTRWFGWWAPASTLMDPNILATTAPWLSAFAPSLSAGFWEEFASRALPIAGALIAGNYFGRRKLFLIFGLILQAIIFGGLHAFYAQQPAYFRIVELIAPSFIWAGVYIGFGLLPGIICHYLWDLMWFAMPLMISQAPEMFMQKCMIIVLALAPLLIVLYRRVQAGSWYYADDSEKNSAWQRPTEESSTIEPSASVSTTSFSQKTKIALFILGLVGAGAMLFFGNKTSANRPLLISRDQAIQVTEGIFKTISHSEKNWRILTNARAGIEGGTEAPSIGFVWRTQKELYTTLLGSYIPEAQWAVRFASFEGDIAERAEEYTFYIHNTQEIQRLQQTIPENAPGTTLSQAEARGIALKGVEEYFKLSPDQLKEISAVDLKRPGRKDWQFIFQDTTKELKADGQARIAITIAGDRIIDCERSVFVPEIWSRTEAERTSTLSVFGMINILLAGLICMLALGSAGTVIMSNFNTKRTLITALCIALLMGISATLNFTNLQFNFSTAQPFSNQYSSLIIGLIGWILMLSVLGAPVLAHLKPLTQDRQLKEGKDVVLAGIAIVCALFGLGALINGFLPSFFPPQGNLSAANSSWPLIHIVSSSLTQFLRIAGVAVLLSRWITLLTNGWTKKTVIGGLSVIIIGIGITNLYFTDNLLFGLLVGTATGIGLLLAHYFVLQYDERIAIVISGTFIAIRLLQEACFNSFLGSWYSHGFAAICVIMLSIVISKKLEHKSAIF